MNLTLCYIFEDLSARLANVDYQERADAYREEYMRAWAGLSFAYDLDLDGVADDDESGDPARVGAGTVFLTGRG